jgi:hypothetical protein
MAVMCALLLAGMAAKWVWTRLKSRRARIEAERDETEELLRGAYRFDTADPVDDAFEDFQQSLAVILDRDPQRRDELVRDLEAATAVWERAEFDGVVKPLRRDREFRRSIKAAHRAANDQT